MANKVLLTGGTGFIGSYILQQLLEQSYDVLAVVRNADKGRALCSQFENKVSFVVVEDITSPGAYDAVFRDSVPIQYVIHSASPFIYGHSDARREILQPAIEGSLRLLESVLKWGPSVKQVVLTSSLASIVGDPSANGVFTESHWNPITFEQSLKAENTYFGSKTLAEKAAWDFMSQHPAIHFSLTTINPSIVFGPLIFPPQSGEKVNTSNQVIDELVQGLHEEKVPEPIFPAWVDVRDVAAAHVWALGMEAAQNQRFMLVNGLYTMDEVVDIMRGQFPTLRDRLPEPQDSQKPPVRFENSRSEKILGINYCSLENCIAATTESLMEKNNI